MNRTNNLQPINVGTKDSTSNFFINNLLPPLTVSQNVDDAVISFFQQVTDTKEAARTLAAAVILTSVSQGMDPMDTISDFAKVDKGQLNAYLTVFLNLNRVGTSYLGINNSPQTSKYVARMIRP